MEGHQCMKNKYNVGVTWKNVWEKFMRKKNMQGSTKKIKMKKNKTKNKMKSEKQKHQNILNMVTIGMW